MPRRVSCLGVFVLVATVTVAQNSLPWCENLVDSSLPQDDFNACGMSYDRLFRYQATLYQDQKCQNPACMRLYAFADANNPEECLVSDGVRIALRSGILKPLYATCASLTATTPAPAATLTISTATSPPVPTTTRDPPRSTTSAPLSTTAAPPVTTTPARTTSKPTIESSSSGSKSTDVTNESTTHPPSSSPRPSKSPPKSNATLAPQNSQGKDDEVTTESPTIALSEPPARTTVAPSMDATTDSKASKSHQTIILWIVVAVAVVGLVSIVVVYKVRRKKQDDEKMEIDTAGDDVSSKYYSSDGDAGTVLSAAWRQEMDTQLRNDRALGMWRLNVQTITTQRLVGKGSYALVHLVVLNDGTRLASKRLSDDQLSPDTLAQLRSEVHISSTLQHASIVQFAGVAWSSALDFQVLFEFMEGGDLRRYLDNTKSSDPSSWSPPKVRMALAIAEGLAYAHSFNPPLVHRDLKSHNILLTHDLRAKISDFGVARYQSDNCTMTTGVGTNHWLAPEVIAGGGTYTELCDIYSFGVVLTELDTHEIPLTKELNEMQQQGTTTSPFWLLQAIARGTLRPSVSSSCPHAIRDLATNCLSFDPNNRPNALEVSYRLRSIVNSQTTTASSHR